MSEESRIAIGVVVLLIGQLLLWIAATMLFGVPGAIGYGGFVLTLIGWRGIE